MSKFLRLSEAVIILNKYMTSDTENVRDGIVKEVYLMAKDHAINYLKAMPSVDNEQIIAEAKEKAVREFAQLLCDTADVEQVDDVRWYYSISNEGIDKLVKKWSED